MTTTARRTWSDLDVVEWVYARTLAVQSAIPIDARRRGAAYGPAGGPSVSRLKKACAAGLIAGETVTRRPWEPGAGLDITTPTVELHVRLTNAGRKLLLKGDRP